MDFARFLKNLRRKLRPRSKKRNNRGSDVRLVTKMNASIKRRSDPVFARKFVTWGVMISSVMVVVSVFVAVYFNPEAVAHRKFEAMAREYYEDYYYDKFMAGIVDEVFESKMATFEQTGLQPVLLRQLLLYQNGKNAEMKKYFETGSFSCDRNTTSAKFYPVAPYGRTDYTVEYNYSCVSE